MNTKKILSGSIFALSLFATSFAQELPGQKDFIEVSAAISQQTASINKDVSNYTKVKEADATSYKNSLKDFESIVDERLKAVAAYKKDPSDANSEILSKIRQAEENAKNSIINEMTDSVLGQIAFVKDMSQKYYTLGGSLKKFSILTEDYGKQNSIDVEFAGFKIEENILNSADVVQGMLNSLPEGDESLNAMLDSYDKEAMLNINDQQQLTVSEKIKNQSEMLKDYSALLLKVERQLENQKKGIALATLKVYISNIEERLSGANGVEGDVIDIMSGGIVKSSNDLNEFTKIIDKGSSNSSTSTSDSPKRRSFLDNLRKKQNQ